MDSNVIYLSDGTQVNQEDKQAMETLFDEIMGEVRAMQESAEKDLPLADAIQLVLESRSLSTQELRGFQFAVTAVIEHEFAADSEELGLYGFDEGKAFEGEDVIFPGGYDQIATLLADKMDIRISHMVQTISTSGEGVKVATTQGEFQAAQAVITLPLGVLQAGDVTFDPPLPEAKLAAIQSLGMGLLNKVYLKFKEAFWSRDDTTLINYIAEQQDAWAETLNLYPLLNEPILLMFNAGSFGREIETWKDESIVAAAMKVLRTLYGNDIPDPESVLITRWASDPFTHGSYSFLPVNSGPETRSALAESVEDCLYFAGEATSVDYPATVHGAYLSGVAAANQIMESA
jgi:monoamine oxidase